MMSYRTDKLRIGTHKEDTHTHADAGNDNTWRPKLASDDKTAPTMKFPEFLAKFQKLPKFAEKKFNFPE